MGYIKTLVLAFFLTAVMSGCNTGTQEDTLVEIAASDPAMLAAYADARKAMPEYWSAQSKKDQGYSDFLIKVGLPTHDDSLEHIWVDTTRRNGDVILGVLANEPFGLRGLHLGDSVEFKIDQISDWQYFYKGKTYGHFTTKVMMKNMSEEQIAMVKESLGWDQ